MSLEPANIGIEVSHINRIETNECILRIEANGEDVLDILICEISKLFQISSLFMEVFFIVSNLDDKWYVECFLHVFAKDKR